MNLHIESACRKLVFMALFAAIVFTGPHPALGEVLTQPVPQAVCGPGDRTESVQGETTLAERFGSGSPKAYNCNLELIGQFEGEGAGHDMNVYKTCAYYSTFPNPGLRHPGVAVLDVSDSRRPRVAAYLDSPAMLDANESLEFDTTRQLLLGVKLFGTNFDLYDLSADCRHPVLKSSVSLPRVFSHSGQFTADGRTYYGGSYGLRPEAGSPPNITAAAVSAIYAVDTRDPANLHRIATWTPPKEQWRTHSVSLNRDGTRAYVVLMGDGKLDPTGLVILDVSDIQARRPNPQFRIVSTLFWHETYYAEFSRLVTIKGRPYIVFSDIAGALGMTFPPPANACEAGRPNYGFIRLIDIADEKNPNIVSNMMLEVDDPVNCSKVMHDPTATLGYGGFAFDVDNEADAKLLASGYFEGGLRVFDIHDPIHPKEIAYYKPPARRTEARPGSMTPASTKTSTEMGSVNDHTADQVIAPRFRHNGTEIWFTSSDNGFQVVRFSDRFKASHKDLFR